MGASLHPRSRPSRPPLLTRLDRTLLRLSRLLARVAVVAISALILVVGGLYVAVLRPLLVAALPAHATLLAAHTAIALWLLFSTAAHYVLAVSTAPGAPSPADAAAAAAAAACGAAPHGTAFRTASQTWRWCAACAAPKPPRAHHDSTTGACALQMCHYCPAVAGVVGLRNYPHFFRFLLHAWAGSILAAVSCGWLNRQLPHTLAVSWQGDAVFFSAAGAAACAVAVGVLLTFHLYLLCTGQTTIEFYENWAARRAGLLLDYPFNRGVRGNVIAAFGPAHVPRILPWWSVLLLPDVRSPPTPAWMLRPSRGASCDEDDFFTLQLD